jgi:hypothetical protein
MQRPSTPRIVRAAMFPLVVAAALSGLPSSQALAQSGVLSFAGPSVARAGTTVFTGSGFGPNRTVAIAVKPPRGEETFMAGVSDARGDLRVNITTQVGGLHVVRVLSTSGGELARAEHTALR